MKSLPTIINRDAVTGSENGVKIYRTMYRTISLKCPRNENLGIYEIT